MVKEKLIDWRTAISRVPAEQLDQVLAPVFDRAALQSARAIATGLPAGPGAATGRIYFNAERAVQATHLGEKAVLVRVETSPEDLLVMIASEGILTARGGVSSHAALVARQMGKVCVCGASGLHVDYAAKTLAVNGLTLKEGDYLSIDGTSGTVYAGQVKTAPSEVIQRLALTVCVTKLILCGSTKVPGDYRCTGKDHILADSLREHGPYCPSCAGHCFSLDGAQLCCLTSSIHSCGHGRWHRTAGRL